MRKTVWTMLTLAGLLLVSPAVFYGPALAGPLHDAAKSGDAAAVARLVASGAAVDERDAGFKTALHWAADAGHLDAVRALAEKGADINAGDLSDLTPLHTAVIAKHEDVVRFLLASGANVNLVDSDGISPLDDAIRHGIAVGIIEALKGAGAQCGKNDHYSRDCRAAEGQQ